jgi:hypothetical protein
VGLSTSLRLGRADSPYCRSGGLAQNCILFIGDAFGHQTVGQFLQAFPIQAKLIYFQTMEAMTLKYPPIEEGLVEGKTDLSQRAPYRALTRREDLLNAKPSGGTKRQH